MNWFNSSMQRRLMLIVMGGLAIVLVVASSSIMSLNQRLKDYQSLINNNVVFERSISRINFNFKTQVQEWKNVLLRGYDSASREKYWKSFNTQHQLIQEQVNTLVSKMPAGESKNLVKQFGDSHREMGERYQVGFEDFTSAGYEPKAGDAAVKGIDREPSKLLTRAAKQISDDMQSLVVQLQEGTASVIVWAQLSVLIVAVIVVAVLWLSLKRGFLSPLQKVMADIRHFAEGDFSQNIDTNRLDELGELARNLDHMQSQIVNIISAVKSTSSELNQASSKINTTANEMSQQTGMTDDYMIQVATAMNEMSMTVQEVAANAANAAEAAQSADTGARNGLNVMDKTIDSLNALSQEVDNVSQVMDKLEQDTARVGAVLDVIKGVAEQTNLLALNAAIEAARAGEQGRGFAVVADEVRGLAQRTQESTEEIQQIIETVQSGASAAVRAMREGKEQTDITVTLAGEAGESLRQITDAIGSIRDMNTQIATAAEEQSHAAESINENVTSVTELAQNAHESARLASEIASELDSTSGEMAQLITRFTV